MVFELLKDGPSLLLAFNAVVTGYPGVLVDDVGDDEEVNYIPNEAYNAADHQVDLHPKVIQIFIVYKENNPAGNPPACPNEQASDLNC